MRFIAVCLYWCVLTQTLCQTWVRGPWRYFGQNLGCSLVSRGLTSGPSAIMMTDVSKTFRSVSVYNRRLVFQTDWTSDRHLVWFFISSVCLEIHKIKSSVVCLFSLQAELGVLHVSQGLTHSNMHSLCVQYLGYYVWLKWITHFSHFSVKTDW